MSRRNGTRKLFKLVKQDDAVLNSIEELNTGLFTTLLFVVSLPPSPTPLGAYAKKTATATITAKSNRFKAKQQLCTCITHFGTLICRQCTTTTCWELPNFTFCGGCEHKRQQLSFSFLELGYSLLELNSRKTYQHLSNWTRLVVA